MSQFKSIESIVRQMLKRRGMLWHDDVERQDRLLRRRVKLVVVAVVVVVAASNDMTPETRGACLKGSARYDGTVYIPSEMVTLLET